MSDDQTTELMEEFKALSHLVRSGKSLTDAQMARRKEIRIYLKEVLLGKTGVEAPQAPISQAEFLAETGTAPPGGPMQAAGPPPGSFDPSWAPNQYKAGGNEIEAAQRKAEENLAPQDKGAKPRTPQEAGEMYLKQKGRGVYTAPVDNYHVSAYYADYIEMGFEFVDMNSVTLDPLDSATAEQQSTHATSTTADRPFILRVPSNLAFLDDYPIIYELGLLPTPDQDTEPDRDDPNLWVPGKRRVILHLLNGQTRRGTISYLKKGDTQFTFELQGSEKRTEIKLTQIKAIFVQNPPNSDAPKPKGKVVTVIFNDRRTIQGVSNDYAPGASVFTLVPQATNNQFERVVVNGQSVIEVN